MIYVIFLGLLALIVYGIAKAASGGRYSKMTEEEFEVEAKRSSLMGAGVAEFAEVHRSESSRRIHSGATTANRSGRLRTG
jgi:hypothetical protein